MPLFKKIDGGVGKGVANLVFNGVQWRGTYWASNAKRMRGERGRMITYTPNRLAQLYVKM